MGFTSYWTIKVEELPADKWQRFKADLLHVAALCRKRDIALSGCHMDAQPVLLDGVVCVNGVGGGAHETFEIQRYSGFRWNEKSRGDFCKTARKPYNMFVSLALIAFKWRFGRLVTVSSDGSDQHSMPGHACENEWAEEFELAKELFGVDCSWTGPHNNRVLAVKKASK